MAMNVRDLRTLAKEYATGVLNKEDYRKLRSELFEDIISGEVEVEDHDFLPPIGYSDGDATGETVINYPASDKEATQPKSTTAAGAPATAPVEEKPAQPPQRAIVVHGKFYKFLLYGGVLTLVFLVILLALLITNIYKASTTSVVVSSEMTTVNPSGNISDTTPPSPPVSKSTTSDNMIKLFLSNNDWSNESMKQFLSDWYNMSYEEYTNAMGSTALLQLNQAIYQQFQEQNAMLVLGDNDAVTEKQLALINFAEQLGFNDPRLVMENP